MGERLRNVKPSISSLKLNTQNNLDVKHLSNLQKTKCYWCFILDEYPDFSEEASRILNGFQPKYSKRVIKSSRNK